MANTNMANTKNAQIKAESEGIKAVRSDSSTQHSQTGNQLDRVEEIGGRKGLNPVRYGDWEYKGRCIDF